MDILYDYEIFTRQRFGGISRYFYELIKGISSCPDMNVELFMGLNNSHYDFKAMKGNINVIGSKFSGADKFHFLFNRINKIKFRKQLSESEGDIFHKTYYSDTGHSKFRKNIVTIHDMTHELYPGYFASSDNTSVIKKQCIDKADGVICVSETTKKDLISLYGLNDKKIRVIYHGVNLNPSGNSSSLITGPYILYVGQRWGYKNFNVLLTSYNHSPEIKNKYRLVCFGGGDFNYSERLYINERGLTDNVIYIQGNDSMLGSIYSNAALFVYTSLYEGFGFPPLEAMICGCPVLAGLADAVKEIAGDAAHYFDPSNYEDLSHKLKLVLEDSSLKEGLLKKGFERAKLFSWDKSVSEHLKFYKEIA